ncbi:hypothetical protein OAV47_00830 [bacterium]|nr:hypothetical protein [bacterium]
MTRPTIVGPLAALSALACATPDPVFLDEGSARAALGARADASPPLELSLATDLPGSLLASPGPEACARPDQSGYWYLRAAAWAPKVRAARRELAAARGEQQSAGAPAPVGIQVIDQDFSGDSDLVNALAAFDLIGLLGLGPSGADEAVAEAQVEAARAALEDAAWRAWLDAERALVQWQAAAIRTDRLAQIGQQADRDLQRVQILTREGRIGRTHSEAAEGAAAELTRRLSLAADEASRARAGLAAVVGLDPQRDLAGAAPVIPAPEALGPAEPGTWFDLDEHLESHPSLRVAQRTFELRESQVRQAAADAWPGVALGPRLGFLDPTQIGGVLRITVPFPSSWEGRLAAAIERRDAALAAYEDQLHLLQTAEIDALTRVRQADSRVEGASADVVKSLLGDWEAARAAFRVQRTPLEQWTGALRRLSMRATWDIDDWERSDLAALDLVASRGPMAAPLFMEGSR